MLNAASNGDFMTRTVEEAYTLIGNMASSNCNSNPEYSRSIRDVSSNPKVPHDLDFIIETKLEHVLNKLLKGQQKSVYFSDDAGNVLAETVRANHEDEFRNNTSVQRRPQGQGYSFGSRNFVPKQQEPTFQQESPVAARNQPVADMTVIQNMLQQLLDHQSRGDKETKDLSHKVDAMYMDLNGKFETLSTEFQQLSTQTNRSNDGNHKSTGTQPRKQDQSKRIEYVAAITLRSGK